jgi:hypothetical protein
MGKACSTLKGDKHSTCRDMGVDERIILHFISKKWDMNV